MSRSVHRRAQEGKDGAVSDIFATFSIPWVPIIRIVGAGLLCGVIAGALPARRAARLDILDAIAIE